MVKSMINPEKVKYKEIKDIDNEDLGHESTIYEYDIFDRTIEIALGKPKYQYTDDSVIYYPIYFLHENKIIANIGVFEIESHKFIDILDEFGDVALEKGNIILFHFVNKEYIHHHIKEQQTQEEAEATDKDFENIEKNKISNTPISKTEINTSDDNDDNDDDVTKIKIPEEKKSKSQEKRNKQLEKGIFHTDENKKIPVSLTEETKEQANQMKEEYTASDKNTWIEDFMKNNHYDIIENEGKGDCFFFVICEAFEQIGKITSVDTLRTILANEANDEIYQQYRTIYVNFLGELQTKEKEMKNIKKTITELKKRSERTNDKKEIQDILDEANKMVKQYDHLKLEKEDVNEIMREFKFMEGIDTLEKFKEFIETSNYWADTWAISTLEKILNIKIMILSEQSYLSGDYDSVFRCGQLNDEELEKAGKFTPDYYIITSYSGNHYELVSYKKKRIMKFSEIPYDMKSLVINKCMEKNAGPYYLIQDFRNLKTKLGLSPDEGNPKEEEEHIDYDLYDPEIVFTFHSKSDPKPKAGKGSGEKIPETKLTEFNLLNKEKQSLDWRRKLDDTWTLAQFTLDNHKWASVQHFVLGNQYKKGFPDFYLQFSLDSNSEISKDVNMAKAAATKSGKFKEKTKEILLRPANVKIDLDYVEKNREESDRIRALEAKFTQNLDLKKILLETQNAKLVHFVRGMPPEADEFLMKLRKQLQS